MKKIFLVLLLMSSIVNLNANQVVDKDNDLVDDKYDKCLNTPEGVCVDNNGCTKQINRIINFKTASSKIASFNKDNLNGILAIANECFGYKILLKGHTDSIYLGEYNQKLSKRRVLSLRDFLIKNKIDKNRIIIEWYGETYPISSNVTSNGRFKNRRVEVVFF